jgi:hypothetical protein
MLDALSRIFRRDIATLRREVELYPDDASLWKPLLGMPNCGGTLVLHLAGNLRYLIGAVLGGGGYVRDRQAEFTRRDVTRAQLVEEIKAADAEVAAALRAFDPARLEQPYPVAVAGVTLDAATFLLHLSAHLAYHLGQLDYHRRAATGHGTSADAVSISALAKTT